MDESENPHAHTASMGHPKEQNTTALATAMVSCFRCPLTFVHHPKPGPPASDDKKCLKAAKNFEKHRLKDLKSKHGEVRDRARAWGGPTDKNGITLTFKTQQQVNADAPPPPGYNTEAFVRPDPTSDHKASIYAEFSEDLKGKDLEQTIAHEGTHIEDDFGFLKSYDAATGLYSLNMNFTHFETEFRAFDTGSMVEPYSMFRTSTQLTNFIYGAYPNADQLEFSPSLYPQWPSLYPQWSPPR